MDNETNVQALRDKIDQLNKQAWDTRVNDSLRSSELSREAVELARGINYQSGLAHALKTLSFSFVRTAKNNEAMPLLQEALLLFQSLNDLRGQTVVYGYLAIIQSNQGNYGAALELLFKALELSEQIAFKENIGTNHYHIGVTYKHLGNFEKALDSLYNSLSIYRELDNRLFQSYSINVIGSICFETQDYTQALNYYQQGLILRQEAQDKLGEAGSLDNIGFTYFKLKNYSEAIDYCTRSLAISKTTGDRRSQANAMHHLAEIYKQTGDELLAKKFSNESLQIRKEIGDKRGETENYLFLASLHKEQTENSDEIFNWLCCALNISEEIKGVDLLSKTRIAFYEYYKQKGLFKNAIEQLELHVQLEKELNKISVQEKIKNLEISHKAEEAKKEADAIRLRNKELSELYAEIREQKDKLEITLADLKSTQAQLIQSEKMASLGELTAGIAHEIQNPLNFVNNFSEVSVEMIDEMKQEIKAGNTAGMLAITNDLTQNLQKIIHHGKRADAIVKSMLQHSRKSSGQKEPADINALLDECLFLSYHGLRAKDKSFNATLQTDYDQHLGKINVIPQDIGRVFLNVFNNAFYSVNEKSKKHSNGYEPVVSVSAKRLDEKIEIRIKDNGLGIQQKIRDKIFQPFFTTKPTGEGAGLGLSLSYDIIAKEHGGELKVDTKEGEYAEFIILLPVHEL